MAKKKKSKVDIIAAFVAENPDSTWAKASKVLASEGISSGYFSSQRSKLKASSGTSDEGMATFEAVDSDQPQRRGPKPGRKAGRKPGSKSGRKPAGQPSSGAVDLTAAVEFARKAGGLQAAQALLSQLESVQV